MDRLTPEKRTQIIPALVEGNSLRSVCRMTGAAMNTVLKLLADVGESCSEYRDKVLRNLSCKRIQCDEVWQFCYAKEKNVSSAKLIGDRSTGTAYAFVRDLADRLANRIQPSRMLSEQILTMRC